MLNFITLSLSSDCWIKSLFRVGDPYTVIVWLHASHARNYPNRIRLESS
jgi:hypothetical protein